MSPSSESAPDPGGDGRRRGTGTGASIVPSRTDGTRERPPVVPGVVLRTRLRDAGSGRVWSGKVTSTGTECTVRHLPLPPPGPARDEVVQAAERLVTLRHPHLVTVTEVIVHDDGLALLAQPVAGAISLSRLLGVRERIEPGEVVTVGLPMAQALTAAHAIDVVHGSLTSDDILLEPNGRPVLAGVGMAGLLRLAGTPAGDVRDLADLLLDTMLEATGPDAAAVAVAVATALVDDPHQRPAAAELAAALGRSCPPLAVRLVSEPIEPLPMPPPPPGVDPAALSRRGTSRGRWSAPENAASGVAPGRPAGSAAGPVPPAQTPTSASPPGSPPGPGPGPDLADAPVSRLSAVDGGEETTLPRPGPTGVPARGAPPPAAPPVAPSPVGAPAAADAGPSLSPVDEVPDRAEATLLLRGTGARTEPRRSGRPIAGKRGGSGAAAAATGRTRTTGGRKAATTRGGGPSKSGPSKSGPSNSGGPKARSRPGSGHSARRPRAGSRPRRGRWFLPATALIGVVVVVVTMLALTGGSSDSNTPTQAQSGAGPGSGTAATAGAGGGTGGGTGGGVASNPVGGQSPEQRWRTELENLDAARAAAFQGGDENALTLVYAPDSSALAQDTGAMREMVALGAHATGLRSVIDELRVTEEGAEVTVLRITDRQQPYSFVSADGTVLSQRPGKPAQTRDVTLVNTADGWRIAQITIVS